MDLPQSKQSENDAGGVDAVRASASLPGLDVEITHRPAIEGEAEEISIHLRAAPSFEAFGRALGATDLFTFWTQSAQLAWLPWLEAARTLALPWTPTLPRPREAGGTATRLNAAKPQHGNM
jgi:hypothetical protein